MNVMAAADSSFWENLLEFIDDQRVIPIVGPELLRIEGKGGGEQAKSGELFDDMIARQLAEKLKVECQVGNGMEPLDCVARQYLLRGGLRQEVYSSIRSLLREANVGVPTPLRQLAQISAFKLFISTTFDSLMEDALNAERYGGEARTTSLSYTPNNVQDIEGEMRGLSQATVYHLFGRVSAMPNYVVTEEDMLEFVHSLLTGRKRPELLFDELKNNHLLMIGTRFPDWLTRFFLRLAKGTRLSVDRDCTETLIDSAGEQQSLVVFLNSYSRPTRVYTDGGPADFVAELLKRYQERHGKTASASGGSDDGGKEAESDEMPAGAVFISYASEDLARAKAIHDALEAAGVDVWLDKRQLKGGDDFTFKIKRYIRRCSLFLPIISHATQERLEGYFRMEWNLAAERSLQIDESIPFIVPVVIDETSQKDARVPEQFSRLHWMWLKGGEADTEFSSHVVQLVREARKRQRV
jgi:TIR domain/SIR2-like domain